MFEFQMFAAGAYGLVDSSHMTSAGVLHSVAHSTSNTAKIFAKSVFYPLPQFDSSKFDSFIRLQMVEETNNERDIRERERERERETLKRAIEDIEGIKYTLHSLCHSLCYSFWYSLLVAGTMPSLPITISIRFSFDLFSSLSIYSLSLDPFSPSLVSPSVPTSWQANKMWQVSIWNVHVKD